MLLAAADPTGNATLLWRATQTAGQLAVERLGGHGAFVIFTNLTVGGLRRGLSRFLLPDIKAR